MTPKGSLPDSLKKLARRRINGEEVRAVLANHVVIGVVPERRRYVLLGRARGRPLIVVVADDILESATVIVSAYEPDPERGWTEERINRILGSMDQEGGADGAQP